MPPKKDDKKKGKGDADKQLLSKSLRVTYQASCKALDVKPLKKLQLDMQKAEEDGLKLVDRIAAQDYSLTGRGVRAICDCLAGYGYVKNLAFWHCNVGDEGVDAVCDLLRAATSVFTKASKLALLEITHDFDVPLYEPYPFATHREDPSMTQEGHPPTDQITALANKVAMEAGPVGLRPAVDPASNELVSTCVPEGRMSISALKRLGDTLGCRGIVLRTLVLDHNGLGDGGAVALCSGLRTCPSLQQLSLAYNGIGPEGAAAVAPLLHMPAEQNTGPQIKLLNMQGNYIGDDGLKAFGEALKLSAHIKALVLAANRMGGNNRVDCTQAFASGINDNHSLQRVDLNFNFFSAEEVREFLPVLILKADIKQFRVTPHVNRNHHAGLAMSKAVSAELVEIVAARNKKGGKKGGKKKAKK